MTSPEGSPEDRSQTSSAVRILVIDDELILLTALSGTLRRAGYFVRTAHSAERGLALLEQEAADVIITDVIMPRKSGIDVIATVNVQHLESLNDHITELSGVRVRETIPDAVVGRADEVVLIDLTREALLDRLRSGKIYPTDRIDAAVIAHFAEATKPKLRQMPDEVTSLLADLVARRRQIVEMIAAEAQRTRRMSDKRLTKSVAGLRKALEKELSELDVLIDDQIRGSAVWVEKEDLLASVPGVGKTIARALIAELPELGSLDRRQIAALAGLAPWTRQSGQWRGKSFIGGGRKSVRSSLFVGAMVAARYNPQLKSFRDKLVAAGKPKLIALVAVARKLITILNAILRDRRPWQPIPA